MDRKVFADPVYLGLTRPATVVGLPYGYVLFSITVTMFTLMGLQNPGALILSVPLYGLGRWVCHYDIRQFSIIGRWCVLRAGCMNGFFWGGNSYSEWGSVK